MSVDCVRIYQINGQVSKVKNAPLAAGVGANQSLVAGVSGTVIRVLGFSLQSQAAAQGTALFKSASGGTALSSGYVCPPSALPPYLQDIKDCGYFETLTGEGLFVDVGANSIFINVYYVTYTPS